MRYHSEMVRRILVADQDDKLNRFLPMIRLRRLNDWDTGKFRRLTTAELDGQIKRLADEKGVSELPRKTNLNDGSMEHYTMPGCSGDTFDPHYLHTDVKRI